MNLTTKQIEIMKVVAAGAIAGAVVDLDQLLERLPYTTTKESLQFSLRAIERHGLIDRSMSEHRRGRARRLVKPTDLGMAVINGTGRPPPGPGAAVGSRSEKILPEPVSHGKAEDLPVSEDLPQPAILSLPELTFSEPELVLEEQFIG